MEIYVVVVVVDVWLVPVLSLECLYPSFYIQGGRGYKKGNQVGYNMISIRILSLLAYFTDIAIYSVGSTPWSSRIFWMMDQLISDPSLIHPSPCVVVPRARIPRQQPLSAWQVSTCWVILIFLVCDEVGEYSIHEPSTPTQNRRVLSLGDQVLFLRVDRIGAPIRCSPLLSN
jgi:hypothetical protein